MEKICSTCKTNKPITEFYLRKDSKRKNPDLLFPMPSCKDCIKERWHKLRADNKPVHQYKDRLRGLQRKYGITIEDYKAQLVKQNGKCAICGGEPTILCVDHSHTTGQVRGLLCKHCNSGLGYMKDNVNNLTQAINYLKEYDKIHN